MKQSTELQSWYKYEELEILSAWSEKDTHHENTADWAL